MEIADLGVKIVMVCPGPVVSNIHSTTLSTDIETVIKQNLIIHVYSHGL